jgi:hypothetical protein
VEHEGPRENLLVLLVRQHDEQQADQLLRELVLHRPEEQLLQEGGVHQPRRQRRTLAVLLRELRHGEGVQRRLVLLRRPTHVGRVLAVVAARLYARQAGVNFAADETAYDDVSHGSAHITEILEEAEKGVRLFHGHLVAGGGGAVVGGGGRGRAAALLPKMLQEAQDHLGQHVLGHAHQLVGRPGPVTAGVLPVLNITTYTVHARLLF